MRTTEDLKRAVEELHWQKLRSRWRSDQAAKIIRQTRHRL